MKPVIALLLFVFMISAVSCKKDPQGPKQPKPIDLPAKAGEVISGSNSFGIDLFRNTALEENGNLMLSPLSASTALTMLLNGCNTQTYEQIRDMLGYEGLTLDEINDTYRSLVGQLLAADPEVQLALANAVFYRQDFQVKQPFLMAMDSSFESKIAACACRSGYCPPRTCAPAGHRPLSPASIFPCPAHRNGVLQAGKYPWLRSIPG